VLGHEITGESEELGPVLVYPCWGCGQCRHCVSGEEQLCLNGSAPGWTQHGGYAEYLAVPSQRYHREGPKVRKPATSVDLGTRGSL